MPEEETTSNSRRKLSNDDTFVPGQRKMTIRQRKRSEISTKLRRWKSLPARLAECPTTCCENELMHTHKLNNLNFRQDEPRGAYHPAGRRLVCRAASNAGVEYAVIRTAIQENNRLDLLNTLNRKHANINALGSDGLAAIHYAAILGTRQIVEMLICFGAKINLKSKDGDYPLDLAVRAGSFSVAQYLIEKGACVDNVINGTPPTKGKKMRKNRSHTVSTMA